MSNRALITQYKRWRKAGENLALVTVVATEGSTYSKAGRHILITSSGEYAGLVSGGCLEGDLAQHAADVIKTGCTKLLTYDMRDDADEIWGIGVGCNGLIKVLVQCLDAENEWAPFDTLAAAMGGATPKIATLVTHSNNPDIPVGTLSLHDADGRLMHGPELSPPSQLPQAIKHAADISALHWELTPWPRLLVLGAGPDAAPVCDLALGQGWNITIADHRPAYIESPQFASTDQRFHIDPANLHNELDCSQFSAIVIMSHHLDTDQQYLQKLTDLLPLSGLRYLGVLGPAARRRKLLDGLIKPAPECAALLRGPVGLDIGANSPESIALALISEIQAVLWERPGSSLGHHVGSA